MYRCPKCQRLIQQSDRFCTYCGFDLSNLPQMQQQAMAQYQQPPMPQYQQPVQPQPQVYAYPPQTPPKAKEKRFPVGLVVGIVVLVLVLVAAGVFLVSSGVLDDIFDRSSDSAVATEAPELDWDSDHPKDDMPTAPVPAEAEDVELTIWISEIYAESVQGLVEEFAARYPEYDLDIEYGFCSEADMATMVGADPAGAADLFVFPDDQLRTLVEAGAVENLDAYADLISDNLDGAVGAATFDGSLYAFPMTASNGYFLYYDSDFFTAADVTSLETMCRKAAASGKKVLVPVENGWYLYSFFAGAGLELTEDGCNWNCSTGEQVCQSIQNLVNTGGLSTCDSLWNAMEHGEDVVAVVSGTWDEPNVSRFFGNYACAKLPKFDLNGRMTQMRSFCGYKLVGINPYCENVEAAVELANWLTGEEAQRTYFAQTQDAPTNIKVSEEVMTSGSEILAALVAQSQYSTTQRVNPGYWDASRALGQLLATGSASSAQIAEYLDMLVAASG